MALFIATALLPATAKALQVELSAPDGIYNLFVEGGAKPAIVVHVSGTAGAATEVALSARDLLGRAVEWKQTVAFPADANATSGSQTIQPEFGVGFYQVSAHATAGDAKASAAMEIGVVHAPYPGLRPESFFASNTSGMRLGRELQFLKAIGMRIQRTHFNPRYADGFKVPAQPNGALLLNFKDQDATLAQLKANDNWVLPICGYSLEGTIAPLAQSLGQYGPPRDYDEFCATWEQILRHYPEIKTIEFWNEPWIFEWTWAADGAAYRKLQKQWCEMALRVHPGLRIIAGNSPMFVQDHIQVDPGCYQNLLAGVTNHPYSTATGQPSMRGGDQQRAMDFGTLLSREMGLRYSYLTEGGTEWQTKDIAGDPHDNNNNAWKIVQYYLHAALTGNFQGNAQWEIGYGPAWTRANVAYATMTHFLEDRPIVADIWPNNELVWGAVFANPKFVTDAVRGLPRAADLAARWEVAVPDSRGDDATKVAVVWSTAGVAADRMDTDGTLTINDPGDIHAYDLTGRQITPQGGALAVPFNEYPVFLTSDALDVVGLRAKIAAARIEHITPVNFYALSLAHPADQPQSLIVRMENQLNRELKGTLSARIPSDANAPVSVDFTIPPAKLIEVSVPWKGIPADDQNQYGVALTASTDAGAVSTTQMVNVARFVKKTIVMDGSLSSWQGVTPLLLDSDQLKSGVDLSQYLLNPQRKLPAATAGNVRIVARVYTAYDDANVYIAAAVQEPALKCTAGEPVVESRQGKKIPLPYKSGVPDGLHHIRNCGDALLLSFGFRDRVPGHGRQMDDPYAWKGHFYDVDNQYVANISTDGPQLIRLWGPDTTRATPYQTEALPGVGPVDGAKTVIRRDEEKQTTIYEMAIPRKELTLFNPAAGRCRFSFILCNAAGLGVNNGLEYSRAYGVFDYWNCEGSFSPSWMQTLPCQTFSGIDP